MYYSITYITSISFIQDLKVPFRLEYILDTIGLFVRISPEVHQWLTEHAKKERRSMASFTEFVLRQEMRRRAPSALHHEPPTHMEDLDVSDRVNRLISEAR